jgi:hypothetical protein
VVEGGGAKTPESTYGLSCACGYKVRCGVLRYGDQLGGLVFFDGAKVSRTKGEEIRRCPGCDNKLDIPGLLR